MARQAGTESGYYSQLHEGNTGTRLCVLDLRKEARAEKIVFFPPFFFRSRLAELTLKASEERADLSFVGSFFSLFFCLGQMSLQLNQALNSHIATS